MSGAPKIAAVLMASGRGKRFGSNKLLADFQGRPLFHQILERLPAECFYRVYVVTRYAQIAVAAAEKRFSVVENLSELDDSAETIRLGVEALPPEVDGCMFFVCDQPCLQSETVRALWEAFLQTPDRIIAPVCDGQRGNPVIFPRALFSELASLAPDQAGGAVIARHGELLRMVAFSQAVQFSDVDCPADLAHLSVAEKN